MEQSNQNVGNDYVALLRTLAETFFDLKRTEESLEMFDQLCKIYEKNSSMEDTLDYAYALRSKALLLFGMERKEEALKSAQKSKETLEKAGLTNHADYESNLRLIQLINKKISMKDMNALFERVRKKESAQFSSAQGSFSCSVCGKPTNKNCSVCKAIYYCSAVCQKEDWKRHKTECKKPAQEN